MICSICAKPMHTCGTGGGKKAQALGHHVQCNRTKYEPPEHIPCSRCGATTKSPQRRASRLCYYCHYGVSRSGTPSRLKCACGTRLHRFNVEGGMCSPCAIRDAGKDRPRCQRCRGLLKTRVTEDRGICSTCEPIARRKYT